MGFQKNWGFQPYRRPFGDSSFLVSSSSKQMRVSTGVDHNTLFVDNLPNSAEIPWFKKFFSNFGKVIDAFIPNKRSTMTGNKFGFIRYNNHSSVINAISRASGLWIGRRNLVVKKASFERRHHKPDHGKITLGLNRFAPLQYAQTLNVGGRDSCYRNNDFTQIKDLEKRITINLVPTTSEWLWRSAIADLKEVSTPEIILNAFTELNFKDVQARSMGGKFMLITFPSIEDRNNALGNQVIKGWFQSFKHWNGDAASLSRLVWLKIRGMPLNAWELKSFKKIAEFWGEFLTLDQETLSMEALDVGRLLMVTSCKYKIDEWINVTVKGRNYHVKVWEEECNDPFDAKGVKHKDHQFSTNDVSNSVKDGASQIEMLNKEDMDELVREDIADKNLQVDQETLIQILQESQINKIDAQIVQQRKKADSTESGGEDDDVEREDYDKDYSKDDAEYLVDDMAKHASKDTDKEADKNIGKLQLSHSSQLAGAGGKTLMSDGINEATKEQHFGVPMSAKLSTQDKSGRVNEEISNSTHGLDSFVENSIGPLLKDGQERDINSGDILLDSAQSEEAQDLPDAGLEELQRNHEVDTFEASRIPIHATVKGGKGKKKRKTIDEILGFSKVNAYNKKGGRNKNKCVVLRSAVAAAALSASISSDGINNRNRIVLNEAQTIWEMNKLYGIGYDGDEDEVISKIAEMIEHDKVKAAAL